MSQENVENAKRGIDAYNRGDVEALADLVTPDFELFPAVIGVVEGGSYRGRDGLATYFETLSDAWEEARILPDELRDLGERVLVLGRIEGVGRINPIVTLRARGATRSKLAARLDHVIPYRRRRDTADRVYAPYWALLALLR